ncbi:cytochrome c [Bacillus sp. NP157]|nr:cytochrome c [Bacillus sp. NP157]
MRNLLTAALVMAVSAPVLAAAPAKPARLGMCAACHGENGLAINADAPNLAGQKAVYLRSALHQYRDGHRDNTVMRAIAGPLSDADIDQLSQWYAAQTPSKGAP